MTSFRYTLTLLVFLHGLTSHASEGVEKAKKIFEAYVEGYHKFDPSVMDLYSDDALIQNKRTYPFGFIREIVIPAPQYKSMARATMPLAQARGDKSQYNDPFFTEESRGVRVSISRYSVRKDHTSPMSLLIGPSQDGTWLILEEKTESTP